MALTIVDSNENIHSDEVMLKKAQDQLAAALETAQEYSIIGSRTVKLPEIERLERLVSKYERRVLRKKGYTDRNLPDFNKQTGGTSIDE